MLLKNQKGQSKSSAGADYVKIVSTRSTVSFAALGEPGITRPKDALRLTNNLEYKSWAQLLCYCMFCNTRLVSTGASLVLDHLLGCVLCPARVKQPWKKLRAETTGKRKAKEEQHNS